MRLPPPRLRAFLLLFALSVLPSRTAFATSVIAPSFAELVAEADSIVRARVIAVRAAWVDNPQGRVIKTFVTFETLRQLKGPTAPGFTLSFLGGELDGQAMRVAGMPRFEVGQRELLFVTAGSVQLCPLVGLMHGRYRVKEDPASGREYLARNDGVPLTSEHDVQLPQDLNPLATRTKSVAAALSPDFFEQRISAELLRRALP
jgi:hypothetical protein